MERRRGTRREESEHIRGESANRAVSENGFGVSFCDRRAIEPCERGEKKIRNVLITSEVRR